MKAAADPLPPTRGDAPAGADPQPPALDPRVLAGLRQLDPAQDKQLMVKVLTTYRASLARQLGQIQTARQRQDFATVQLAVHTLKSASASVGARGLAQLCGLVEAQSRVADAAAVDGAMGQLADEATRVDAAVQQILSALPPASP